MIGTLSSVVTLISFVTGNTNVTTCQMTMYFIGIIFAGIVFSIWQTYRKTELTIRVNDKCKVKIFTGDLFDFANHDSVVVIPVNEFFDTQVDEEIISSSTLHGQFIRRYFNNSIDILENEIKKALQNVSCFELRRNHAVKTSKYPLGTCIDIEVDDKLFVLVALTHFSKTNIAWTSLYEYGNVVRKLMTHLIKVSGLKSVYMPLMGTGLARIDHTSQFILKYMLDTILSMNHLSISGGLNVVLYPPIAKIINLNEIKY